ncbi:hypothetical protein FLX56_20040 [Synechococcus moorigangaii CMS01]|nr:hypothetical protein [Synechococcus moorigangaii CMS01]
MAMRQHWYGVILGGLLLGMGGFGILSPVLTPVTFAQTPPTDPEERSLLAELWLFNQGWLSLQSELANFPDDLAALNTGEATFEPQLFLGYGARVQQLQEQLRLMEVQLATMPDPAQRESLAAAIANVDQYLANLVNLIQPFETGFNPEAIRNLQEFLDFFDRRNLGEADYGFYGSVTQTELATYLNQQLNDLSATLKTLNETATQGAIAPDLVTSINYLYTSLSLENTVVGGGTTFPAMIQTLQQDNQRLKQRLRTTNLLLSLLLLLGTATLASLYLRKPTLPARSDQQYFPDSEPPSPDLDQLEAAVIKRLQRSYGLTPKANFPVTTPTPDPLPIPQAPVSAVHEPSTVPIDPQANAEAATIDLGLIPEAEPEADFPVQILNTYDALVESYNADAASLASEAIALAVQPPPAPPIATEEELENLLTGLLFDTNAQGEYWAIEVQNQHYLVPRAQLTITPENYDFFQQIFICYGPQTAEQQTIKLLKPARVAATDQEGIWELVQPGIVVLEKSPKNV